MINFNENYKNFKKRVPKPRFGDKVDTTHLRFIDTASEEEIITEYKLIQEKKSKLSSKERQLISNLFV